MPEAYRPFNVFTAGSLKTTDIILDKYVSKENFYFIFGDFVTSLEQKMFHAVNNARSIQSKYTIVYKEHKVTYLKCFKYDKLLIMDIYRASLDDYISRTPS